MCEKVCPISDILLGRGKRQITAMMSTLSTEQLILAKYVMDTGFVAAVEEVDDFLNFIAAVELLLPVDKHDELLEFCKAAVNSQIEEDALRELNNAIDDLHENVVEDEEIVNKKIDNLRKLRRYLAGECDGD